MDLIIVEWFQSLRNGFLDLFFTVITEFGDELAFFVISGILFWCVNKKFAYRLMMVFLTSVGINNIFKIIIARPRPFIAHPDTVVSVISPTHGYSMPSGHAQNGMALALPLNERFGHLKKWVTPVLFVMAALVSLSRVYLGQHYLSDVIVGMLVATGVYLAFVYIGPKLKIRPEKLVYYSIPLMIVLLFIFLDKNFYIAIAGIIGLTLGQDLEQKYINYDVKAPLHIQVLKFVIGMAIALALKEGLKMVLPYPDGDVVNTLSLILDFIRYFILTMWLTLGSMVLFKKLFKNASSKS